MNFLVKCRMYEIDIEKSGERDLKKLKKFSKDLLTERNFFQLLL